MGYRVMSLLTLLMLLMPLRHLMMHPAIACSFEELPEYLDLGVPKIPVDYNPNSIDLGGEREPKNNCSEPVMPGECTYFYSKTIHEKEFRVWMDKYFSQQNNLSYTDELNIAKYVWQTWARFWADFQGYPFEKPSTHGWDSKNWVPEICNKPDAMKSIAHEMFHTWNSIAIGKEQDYSTDWFVEGITTYYSVRSVDNYYKAYMAGLRRIYLEDILPDPKRNIPLTETPQSFYADEYYKGALVGYLLDKELYKLGLDLGYLLRYMYHEYGYGKEGLPHSDQVKKPITNDSILQAVNAVTGKDFTQFFNDYIYGTAILPLPEGDFDYIPHYFLEVSTNRNIYHAGDTFSIEIDFANPDPGFRTDFYMGIISSDGSAFFFNKAMNLVEGNLSDARTYSALVENAYIPTGQTFLDRELFSLTLPEIPLGEYTVFAFLAEPGTTQAGNPRIIGRLSAKNITVTPGVNRAPVLNPIGNKIVVGTGWEDLIFTISASDPDNDPLTYTASGLPPRAIFRPDTKTFYWEPFAEYGDHTVHFEVSDGSLTASEDIIISVVHFGYRRAK